MSVTIGPTSWWLRTKEAVDYYARICPRGTILPDGSSIFCGGSDARSGSQVWIVAPFCTAIYDSWASGRYNNTIVSSTPTIQICCLCEWPNASNRLISCGFNPCEWFVPNFTVMSSASSCRIYWDCMGVSCYWSSTEEFSTSACIIRFSYGPTGFVKSNSNQINVRTVRCITL